MALQQGVSGLEMQGDRNLAAHGVVAVPAASVLPQESTTPGRRHSRASSLPTLKLKRGKSKIKGEQEVKEGKRVPSGLLSCSSLHDPPVKVPKQEQSHHSGQIWMLSQGTRDTTKGKVLTGEMTLI